MFKVVIPARYASSRLPGKPLADIGGRPMILHVYQRALEAGAGEVIVATDDERVREACEALDAQVEMTSSSHATGSDRIAEVAARRGWPGDTVVVNLQGDEPLLPPVLVGQVAGLLAADPGADLATLCTAITSEEEFRNPAAVKVVRRADGRALLFSRAPVPLDRDGDRGLIDTWRHIGLYAYRVAALLRLASLPPCEMELRERLEQLRALHHGMAIAVSEAMTVPGAGVDTPEDLERVRALVGAS
ncbi:MAG: 3-deoxy-manno-octulosonate cytidylyltransferase [Steroidobacteraceae bacterium]